MLPMEGRKPCSTVTFCCDVAFGRSRSMLSFLEGGCLKHSLKFSLLCPEGCVFLNEKLRNFSVVALGGESEGDVVIGRGGEVVRSEVVIGRGSEVVMGGECEGDVFRARLVLFRWTCTAVVINGVLLSS